MTMTREELWDAMVNHRIIKVMHHYQTDPLSDVKHERLEGTISSIAMEDGSGYSFIVKLNTLNDSPNPGQWTVYVRCPKPSWNHENALPKRI